MELSLQSRLLRVIETRQFRRVGGTRPLTFGARVITATNRNLKRMMDENMFRQDLYFRLAVYEIYIPPLRERKEDIRELAEHFLREAVVRHGRAIKGFSRSFIERIESHSFPGNVRELRNLVEQSVIQTDEGEADFIERTTPTHRFSLTETPSPQPISLESNPTLSEQEHLLIESAIRANQGNKSAAARQLGISRPALLRRMAKSVSGAS